MNRRSFLTGVSSLAGVATVGPQNGEFELEEATVSDLQRRIQSGDLTAEKIVRFCLNRIETLDRNGPTLRSVIEINPDALAIARSLDQERQAQGPRGPLHGIPVLLKDNIDTNDQMQTTAGSLALLNAPRPEDSFVAKKLRAAGAVILGKTNLSEWANFRSSRSTSGWSGRGGLTKNPYALDRNACGSSSGSGVAVSANFASLAVGTETDGSIVCPSAINGIVGIKPTLGLISRRGIVPIAASQDTAGPMARTVRDAAILLGALAGPDPKDPATSAGANRSVVDYTKFCNPEGLRGARIGVARQYFKLGAAVDRLMNECLDLMHKAGAEIVDPVEFAAFEKWRDTETTVLLYEFKDQLTAYLSARGGPVKSLADCIAFNNAHRAEEMPFFEQELMEQAQEKGSLHEKEYKTALSLNRRYSRKEGIDALIQRHKLDAFAAPTVGPTFVTDLVSGDHMDNGCTSPAAVAGYPHVTVPAGHVFGLPVGLSFFSSAWTEPTLIKLAYAFEQARNARSKPRFLPTVALNS